MPADKNRCALCGVRDHALGGRGKTGEFMLALPIETQHGRTTWPRIGTNGWCGNADGAVERLSIIRISLARAMMNQESAVLCQRCLETHQAGQGILSDLFTQDNEPDLSQIVGANSSP